MHASGGAKEIIRGSAFRLATQGARTLLTTSLATTPAFDMSEFVGGTIFIPAASGITSLTFFGAPRRTDEQDPTSNEFAAKAAPTYYQLFNSSNVAISLNVTAGNCYALPADVFGLQSLKMVAGGAGGQVEISLKA